MFRLVVSPYWALQKGIVSTVFCSFRYFSVILFGPGIVLAADVGHCRLAGGKRLSIQDIVEVIDPGERGVAVASIIQVILGSGDLDAGGTGEELLHSVSPFYYPIIGTRFELIDYFSVLIFLFLVFQVVFCAEILFAPG